MGDMKERRFYPRFEVPGARIAYKQKGKISLLRRFSNPSELINLGKGGVCMNMNQPLPKGTMIEMQLLIPGEPRMTMRGNIVWTNSDSGSEGPAGVQFLPFGKGSYYNPFSARDTLVKLQKTYHETSG